MTKSDLETSISIHLGYTVDRALKSAGIALPERLKMAALAAFEHQMFQRTPTVARLREALLMLKHQGEFTFDSE